MMPNYFTTLVQLLLIVLVMPYVGAAVISAITKRTNQLIVNHFGTQAQFYFSFFGIIVHELSHAAMALLFRHKIDKISLVQKADVEQTLGYVSHAWNPKSLYQQLGNFFIGMGPLFGIGLAVWLTTYVCWPQLLTALLRLDSSQLWMGIIWWHLLIWLLLCIQFCLALNLSQADWQNIQSGIVSYIVFLAVLAVPLCFIVTNTQMLWQDFGRYILYFLLAMFGFSLVIDVVFNVLTRTRE